MSLRDEVGQYRQSDGLVSPEKNPTLDSTGNGILYTSLYFVALVLRGLARKEDLKDFEDTISRCRALVYGGFNTYFPINGCYNRSGTKLDDQNGHDDYIGLALASKLMKTQHAADILNHRRLYSGLFKSVWNNREPGNFTTQAWFGRMPDVVAHFIWCAGERPNVLRRAYWSITLVTAALFNIKDSTSAMLSWCRYMAADDSCPMVRLARWVFEARFKKVWPCGMAQVLGVHFRPEHPLSIYW